MLWAGQTFRAEVRAEEAGKVDEDHDVQHDQDTQQEGAQAPLTHILQEEVGEVGLRGQAEEEVHDQVDILIDLVEEEMLGIVDLHHHANGEEDIADFYQQCQDTPTYKAAQKDARYEGTHGLEGKENKLGNTCQDFSHLRTGKSSPICF